MASTLFVPFLLLVSLSLSTAFQLRPIQLVRDETNTGLDIGPGRKVGGRSQVPKVESNEEVQDLGRFSVQEYNRQIHGDLAKEKLLNFSKVTHAQRQVVSGIKYYLRIVTTVTRDATGEHKERVFDAVVVAKPWLGSRTLVSFVPAESK